MEMIMKYDVLRRHIGDKLYEQGDQREAEERDVAHLVKNGVLRPASGDAEKPREDGPTVAEYVTAGYLAANYPPQGYASRSTPEEIAEAVAAQEAAEKAKLEQEAAEKGQKADEAPANKAEKPAPKTKASD
jgi:hypothetical protein